MAPSTQSRSVPAIVLLTLAASLTLLVYWIGLNGPFILDDEANLRAIPEWLAGDLPLSVLVFERGAGMFGRPVSMASFALSAWIGGFTPFSMKLGNLLIHLLCGATIFGFLRALFQRDPNFKPHATLVAAIVASLWLLHPLHASTVLYAVQRMAQLSTLLILLGLWLYVALRQRLERGESAWASVALLAGIPAITVFAFLAKENGALLPLLCGVVEFTYFRGSRKVAAARLFSLFYVALPILGVAGLALFKPRFFLDGYISRDFTLVERLLSQGRALADYVFKLVIPNPPQMGVYTDDFATSTGLLSPPTTLLALLFLVTVSFAAWRLRNRIPALLFGWGFFLVAHAMEAGPISLELYFEHRNYLPAIGLLAMLVALAQWTGQRFGHAGLRPVRIGVVALAGMLALYAFGTHGRAQVWRNPLLIAESSLIAHPDSLRANTYVLAGAIQRGDRVRIDQILDALSQSSQPRSRSLSRIFRLYTDCMFDQTGNPADLEAFVTQTPLPISIAEAQPFDQFYRMTVSAPCEPLDDETFGMAISRLADRASEAQQPQMVRLRYQSASFFMRAGNWDATLREGRLAWRKDATVPAPRAVPLVIAQAMTGDTTVAQATLDEAWGRVVSEPEREVLQWAEIQLKQIQARTDSAGNDR